LVITGVCTGCTLTCGACGAGETAVFAPSCAWAVGSANARAKKRARRIVGTRSTGMAEILALKGGQTP
jgi:hypothetical protein